MKKSNWISPISTNERHGINKALVSYIANTSLLEYIERVVIHSYRENGNSLEVNYEIYWFDYDNKLCHKIERRVFK